MPFGTLSRRTLLRGVGAAMALPWLEAMAATKTSSNPLLLHSSLLILLHQLPIMSPSIHV
jgi:hypothetical protein